MSSVLNRKLRSTPSRLLSKSSGSLRRIVVVGNGPVGFHLLKTLVNSQHTDEFHVTVFGEEFIPAYDRIHLSDLFSEKKHEDLIYKPQSWYEDSGIDLIVGDAIVEIDRGKQIALSAQGRAVPYDQLVLATGSKPFVPPIDGVELPGVFVYRTIQDVQKIREFSTGCRTGVVIGGGLLGLEAAKALKSQGVTTIHIVESSPFLMARQLDKPGSQLLRQKIESFGYQVYTNWMAEAIKSLNEQLKIKFRNSESLEADVIVIAAGIRPRDELARGCALEVAARGGVVVNDRMQTNDSNIYACGECVAHKGIVYGLVAPGFQMAEVIADQLTHSPQGKEITFSYGDLSTELKLLEIDVATLGESLNPRQGFREIVYRDEKIYRKLTVLGHRLVGCMYVGEWNQKHRVRDAVSRNQRLWPWQYTRFQETGDLWKTIEQPEVQDWPASSIVCTCTGTTRGELSSLIAQGFNNLASIKERSSASTVCGSCEPLISNLCGHKVSKRNSRQLSLTFASIVTLIVFILIILIGPYPVPHSVMEPDWYDDFLLNETWKQVTGYTLLSMTAFAALFSLRKRLTFFSWGSFLTWRAVHAWIGGSTLLGLYWHTGFRMGSNLNFLLFITFISANVVGAVTGLITSGETSSSGSISAISRRARPWMTWFHILTVWPLPLLILFHVLAAYFFN